MKLHSHPESTHSRVQTAFAFYEGGLCVIEFFVSLLCSPSNIIKFKIITFCRCDLLFLQLIDGIIKYFLSLCTQQKRFIMDENRDLNRIKVMLAEKKCTNKWLAEQLGVNATTVSKRCTNSSQTSLDMLSKIADALNVDYTELVRIKRNFGEEDE